MTYKQLLTDLCEWANAALRTNDASKRPMDVELSIVTIPAPSPLYEASCSLQIKVGGRVVVRQTIMYKENGQNLSEEKACQNALNEMFTLGLTTAERTPGPISVDFGTSMGQVIMTLIQERDYQDSMEDKAGSHVTSALNMGGIISAIQHNLNQATSAWYSELLPYPKTTDFLRKIGALCIKAGEMYGMTKRV